MNTFDWGGGGFMQQASSGTSSHLKKVFLPYCYKEIGFFYYTYLFRMETNVVNGEGEYSVLVTPPATASRPILMMLILFLHFHVLFQ